MAYAFPLSIADFLSVLPIMTMTFDLPEAVELSETAGGELLVSEHGERLWQGEISLGDMTADEAAEAMAMIDVARGAASSFMIYDVARPRPRFDPTGSLISGASVTLNSVAASTREISLAGLPVGYQLKRNDYVALSYGSSPVRFGLHRVAAPAVANASGITPLFEVVPNIRAGWVAGQAADLTHALCKARIVPGSVQPGRRRATITSGVSFRWMQTLR